MDASVLERSEPVYETFPGWTEDLRVAKSIDEMPPAARRYLAVIEERAGVPITIVSVGPERNQTLVRGGANRPSIHRAA